MSREVAAIADRCRDCGQATRLLILEVWEDDEGAENKAFYGEPVAHTRADCATMQRLDRETWPTLW